MDSRPSDQLINPDDRVALARWLSDATSRFNDIEQQLPQCDTMDTPTGSSSKG